MKDGAGLLGVAFYIAAFGGWLTSIINDASNDRMGWVVADVIVFPMGVLRGFGMWLGLF
ncbi:hypothetical protein ABJA24_004175 [Providencia rettgeri]|nr:hypothetical protein [Providencia rettgeri]